MTEEAFAHAPRKIRFTAKNIIGFVLLLALAAVFGYSAYTKIGPPDYAQTFTWTFIDMGINSQLWAGVLARVMVGLEIMIALYLLAHIFLRSVTYPLTIGLLVIFCIHLAIQIALFGNDGNCGCFGDAVSMTPLEGILKNLIMIAVAVVLYFIYPASPYKKPEWILALTIAMASIIAPFVIDPLMGDTPKVVKQSINMDALYELEQPPKVDLRKGKHIVVYMSLMCPHCRKAAKKLVIVQKNNPEIPIYVVLTGDQENKAKFFSDTKAYSLPYVFLEDQAAFRAMAGDGVPAIYFINNSVIERDANYFQLDPQYMKEWLGN